ncbi:MAG: ATPase, T2SS/T4P/T4SS family [bacterium]
MAIAQQTKDSIVQILLKTGKISQSGLNECCRVAEKSKRPVEEILVEMGFITQDEMTEARGRQIGVAFLRIADIPVDPDIIQKIPVETARRCCVFPVGMQNSTLVVAMADPTDINVLDDLKRSLMLNVIPVIAGKEDIQRAIVQYYGGKLLDAHKVEDEEEISREQEISLINSLQQMGEEAPVVTLVNNIIEQAINQRTSDIHIETMEKEIIVRFRIDGVLHDFMTVPRQMSSPIISRIKIMSGMNIVERRLPQEGRFKARMETQELDVRVSSMPSCYGEKIVMRILNKSAALLGLEQLGLSSHHLKLFESMINKPHGMILVTGPTGSGKSTTLYAALNRLNSIQKNIITVEDPIEYQIRRINQTQVNNKVGMTFAVGLRSILRQDPDIIMVGEIRDGETAGMAIQAALTGHLVFSTLHCNDASSAPTRMLDMGIEPFLISSSVILVIAQRLVRKICPRCKVEIPREDEVYVEARHRLGIEDGIKIYRGQGCSGCRNTGYFGRTSVYELLAPSERVREAIINKESSANIRRLAAEEGMITLLQSGVEKIKAGVSTVEEVLRAVYVEG